MEMDMDITPEGATPEVGIVFETKRVLGVYVNGERFGSAINTITGFWQVEDLDGNTATDEDGIYAGVRRVINQRAMMGEGTPDD